MPQTKTRVVGSGFTTFRWNGKPIAFLESVQDSGQALLGSVDEIHPLDSRYPIEFATPRALSGGTLSFMIRELWNAPVWQQFTGLANANNIVDVWEYLAQDPTVITCQTIIKPPTGNVWRTKTFHNVFITSIDDTESISVEAMTIARSIQARYTHSTRDTIVAS